LYSRHSSTILSTSSAWICIKGQCQEMHDSPEGGKGQLVLSQLLLNSFHIPGMDLYKGTVSRDAKPFQKSVKG
jgi:hypothetical protein